MSDNRIIFRYILGLLVEKAILYGLGIGTALGVIYLIGFILEWSCEHQPDWMIIPEFVLIFAISWWAVFHDCPLFAKKRTICGYRCTI